MRNFIDPLKWLVLPDQSQLNKCIHCYSGNILLLLMMVLELNILHMSKMSEDVRDVLQELQMLSFQCMDSVSALGFYWNWCLLYVGTHSQAYRIVVKKEIWPIIISSFMKKTSVYFSFYNYRSSWGLNITRCLDHLNGCSCWCSQWNLKNIKKMSRKHRRNSPVSLSIFTDYFSTYPVN